MAGRIGWLGVIDTREAVAITAAGDALLQGGSVPVEMFSPSNLKRPEFGIPVYTGTVTVTLTVDGAATIDAGFSID